MALGWLWWRAWVSVDAVGAAAFGVAGVALGDMTFTLRGRRGTWRHGSSLCVAGMALMALGWLWWRAWVPVDAVGAAAFGGSDVFYAWPPWATGPFLRLWRIMQQCCSWKRSCHTGPPGVTFMPSSAGTIRVSLKLLWATSACCVPRGSLQRRCRCHMPLGFISQKCNWRRFSGLCERPRLSVVVRDVRCGCSLVLDLIRIPCAVYTVYSQGFGLDGLTRRAKI